MTTLCQTYPSAPVARRAVQALRAAGVPARDIRLVIGPRVHDIRHEPAGGFAGPVDPDAPVGAYRGPARRRCLANGGFAGHPDEQRQGSFADADLEVIVDGEDAAGHSRLVSDRTIRKLLRDAAPEPIAAVVDELHHGAVVIADVQAIDPGEARRRLEDAARAA